MDALTLSRLTGITRVDISLEDILLRFAIAVVLSLVCAIVYRFTHKSYAYSYNMIAAIMMVAVIVCMVLMVIDHSLARAFGLVGALAIIRFRTPVKDIRDIIFLFAAVAIGISCGAGAFDIAITGTIFINALALVLYLSRFGSGIKGESFLFKIYCDKEYLDEEVFFETLREFCDSYDLVEAVKGADRLQEFIFSVKLSNNSDLKKLTDKLSAIEGIRQVSALSAMHHMDMQ